MPPRQKLALARAAKGDQPAASESGDGGLKGKEIEVHPDQLQTLPMDFSPVIRTMFGCPKVQEALVKPQEFHEKQDSILNGTTRNLDSFAVPPESQQELPVGDPSNPDKPEDSEQPVGDPSNPDKPEDSEQAGDDTPEEIPEIQPRKLESVFDQEVKGLNIYFLFSKSCSNQGLKIR